MNIILRILTEFYSYTLCLYPASYRKEFQEEMLLDFKDLLTDASKGGILSLIAFCLREARDIPFSNFNPIEPWRFIALTIFMILPIDGIFFIAMKSAADRKLLWVPVVGALGIR